MSLKNKMESEYFLLYPGNYFGDYQILFGHKATETFTVFGANPAYFHCLGKKDFLDLMRQFPDCLCLFFRRAIERRVEFRRIKKLFELYTGIENSSVIKN